MGVAVRSSKGEDVPGISYIWIVDTMPGDSKDKVDRRSGGEMQKNGFPVAKGKRAGYIRVYRSACDW
jgi:hypothetical protein